MGPTSCPETSVTILHSDPEDGIDNCHERSVTILKLTPEDGTDKLSRNVGNYP